MSENSMRVPETAGPSPILWLIAARALALVATACTLWLAFKAPGEEGRLIPWDKAAHFLSFYVLTLLFCVSLPRTPMVALILLMLAAGGAIEVVQGIVGRDADWKDWVADGTGIAFAVLPGWFELLRRRLIGPEPPSGLGKEEFVGDQHEARTDG